MQEALALVINAKQQYSVIAQEAVSAGSELIDKVDDEIETRKRKRIEKIEYSEKLKQAKNQRNRARKASKQPRLDDSSNSSLLLHEGDDDGRENFNII